MPDASVHPGSVFNSRSISAGDSSRRFADVVLIEQNHIRVRASNGLVSQTVCLRLARAAACALTLAACGCEREAAPPRLPSESPPESAPPPERDWVEIAVDPDPGWDVPSVARAARAEADACREVMETRLGIAIGEPPATPLEVRFVHDASTWASLLSAVPEEDRVFWLQERGFICRSGNRIVLSREAEIDARTYLFSLALLVVHSGLGRTNLADSYATWVSGAAMNRLKGETPWERGRLLDNFFLTSIRGPEELRAVCEWSSRPLGTDFTSGARLRALSWFLLYFLANFDVGEDSHVRFGGTPKYEPTLRELVSKRGGESRDALCNRLASSDILVSEYEAYLAFVFRKRGLGHFRNGVLVPWADYVNKQGRKTGIPEDDRLH